MEEWAVGVDFRSLEDFGSLIDDYKYSSYNAMIGNANTKIKREEVLEWFGGKDLFIKIHQQRKLDKAEVEKFLLG